MRRNRRRGKIFGVGFWLSMEEAQSRKKISLESKEKSSG